jgi:hypothetical protein
MLDAAAERIKLPHVATLRMNNSSLAPIVVHGEKKVRDAHRTMP